MAGVQRTKDKAGKFRYRVQFYDHLGRRQSVFLGRTNGRDAEDIAEHVQAVVDAAKHSTSPPAKTQAWLEQEAPENVVSRLVAAGLCQPRERSTLGAFIADYLARRVDVKPQTRIWWGHAGDNLVKFFGADRALDSIHEGAAADFKMHLVSLELAAATIAKRLQVARMLFHDAGKRRLIPSNPFQEVSAKAIVPHDRMRFISPEDTRKVLAACPPTWRTIVGLARWGGLRCPSEVLSLRWDHVNWELGRVTVESPKTAHHVGKGTRTIPLFPELRLILAEAFELAEAGAEYVVGGGYRESAKTSSGWKNANLRTQFERIVRRAGLTPWPKLFQNLRSSRETELAAQYPLHVVTSWLGNSPKVALQHYLQVTDADYARACAGQQDVQHAVNPDVSKAAPYVSATCCNGLQADLPAHEKTPVLQGFSAPCNSVQSSEIGVTRFELATF